MIIDTIGMTTGRNLSRPEEARDFFAPIIDLAARTGVPIPGSDASLDEQGGPR